MSWTSVYRTASDSDAAEEIGGDQINKSKTEESWPLKSQAEVFQAAPECQPGETSAAGLQDPTTRRGASQLNACAAGG